MSLRGGVGGGGIAFYESNRSILLIEINALEKEGVIKNWKSTTSPPTTATLLWTIPPASSVDLLQFPSGESH